MSKFIEDNIKQQVQQVAETTAISSEPSFRAASHSSSTGSIVQHAEINADPKKVSIPTEEGVAKPYINFIFEERPYDYKSKFEEEVVQKIGREAYDRFANLCNEWDEISAKNSHSQNIKSIIGNKAFKDMCNMKEEIGKDTLELLFTENIDRNHLEFITPLIWISEKYKVPYDYSGIPIAWVCEARDLPRFFHEYQDVSGKIEEHYDNQ